MNKTRDEQLGKRVEELKAYILNNNDPKGMAFRCGMDYFNEEEFAGFKFSFFDTTLKVSYPEMVITNAETCETLKLSSQALIFYHMVTSDGSPFIGKWISFAELPEGKFYNQAFQGYSGDELAGFLGNDVTRFTSGSLKIGGTTLSFGDAAFQFMALPRVPIAVVFWKGDEEFHSNCKVLFDGSVGHYLPTDACAVLGSMLVQMIKGNQN